MSLVTKKTSIDKFVRHQSVLRCEGRVKKLRKRLPYRLTDNGDTNVGNKIIPNLGKPEASIDPVALSYIQKYTLSYAVATSRP